MNYAETLGVKAKAVESAIATAAPQVKTTPLPPLPMPCFPGRRRFSPPMPKTWRRLCRIT